MEGKGHRAVFDRLTESFDRDPMRHSIKRFAASLGSRSGDYRMGRTGLLSASPAATGPRTGGNTYYGQHPTPRG